MKKLIIIALLFISGTAFAQRDMLSPKFHILLDYHYNLGLVENGDLRKFTRSNYKMYGNSIHLTGLYNLNTKIALGLGLGLDRYENPGFNSFPIFATVHYRPLSKLPKGYIYSNAGYAIGGSDFVPGFMFDLGIGYKKMFKRHFGLNFQLGYNLKHQRLDNSIYLESQEIVYEKINRYRHSLALGVGLIF